VSVCYENYIFSYVKQYQLDKFVAFDNSKPHRDIFDLVNPDNTKHFVPNCYDPVEPHKLVFERNITTLL